MRILVTGAAGMVGSSLIPVLKKENHQVFATDINIQDEGIEYLDVREFEQIVDWVNKTEPQIIINLAAETDVDKCEIDADHAFKTNTIGAQNIALICREKDILMVHISTAGVFDGQKEGLYTEFDKPVPINVYGKSKFEADRYVSSLLKKYFIARAGWMIGGGPEKDKKFVNKIIQQIRNGVVELYAVTDKFGTPTYTKDFSLGLANLIKTNYYGLYHMACRGFGTRYDVAKEILKILGREDIKIHRVNSDFFINDYPAPRPKSEMMRNLMLDLRNINLMKSWQESLKEYLENNFSEFINEQKRAKIIPADKRKKIVILGGGIAGLMAGYKLSRKGVKVVVLEKYREVGGLARTVKFENFLFDFCAHRFHSRNSELLEEFKNILQGNIAFHRQKSRIYMWDKYLEYPFRLGNLMVNMPSSMAIKSLFGYLLALAKKKIAPKEIISFKDWFVANFGAPLYQTNCLPYASKLWDRDPSELSADWGSQRSPAKFNLWSILKELFVSKQEKTKLNNDTFYPDASTFYYPKEGGIESFSKRLAEEIIANDGKIITRADIKEVELNENEARIFYEKEGKKYLEVGDEIISTISLPYLAKIITPKLSEEAIIRSRRLKYQSNIFINLIINREKVSNDSWLYFPQPKDEIIFNRIVEFKNWSKQMSPADKTSLNADITCGLDDPIWREDDRKIIDKVIEGMVKVDLVKKEEVEEAFVVRVPDAYPIYHLDYKKDLSFVLSEIESLGKIYCIGRTGRFKYNNMDDSVEQGIKIAEKILRDGYKTLSL
ncbi:MAG: putative Dtdp-4-dehydrorhamnose reductase [Parcubacteria group bacterium Athens1014_10]|nr:MAG: putative Dtdp-4-dehydrorhamnose reductase [Parcubacteria group bacterium Athens1014_10]